MKGFTLIELLAVIVILAIILVISVPQINKVITNARKEALNSDLAIILRELDRKEIDKTFNSEEVDETNIENILGIDNKNYEDIVVKKVDGKDYILIKGKDKLDGLIAYGTYDDITIDSEENYDTVLEELLGTNPYNEDKGVNKPLLSQGMIPIKWNGSSWVNTTEDDINWYDYDNKIWANAKTEDGSMWVWIPRYIYIITNKWHISGSSSTDAGTIEVQFTKGINDNWNNAVIGNIETGTTSNVSNNKWTNHPGFTFGDTELMGIWVAKFEASIDNQNDDCYVLDSNSYCDVTTKTIKVVPNVISWRRISIGNAFTTARLMETKNIYGWDISSTLNSDGTYTTDNNNIDTHLMKNVEWGAIAYLSKSEYGKETSPVWVNASNNYTTGCAESSADYVVRTAVCSNQYNTVNGVEASTTGTIYGVYDMSGGSLEYISAYINNNNSGCGVPLINSLTTYKDIYSVAGTDSSTNNYPLTVEKKGDALYETSSIDSGAYSWYMGNLGMPTGVYLWFVRGGITSSATPRNLYSIDKAGGCSYSFLGFRPTLIVYDKNGD